MILPVSGSQSPNLQPLSNNVSQAFQNDGQPIDAISMKQIVSDTTVANTSQFAQMAYATTSQKAPHLSLFEQANVSWSPDMLHTFNRIVDIKHQLVQMKNGMDYPPSEQMFPHKTTMTRSASEMMSSLRSTFSITSSKETEGHGIQPEMLSSRETMHVLEKRLGAQLAKFFFQYAMTSNVHPNHWAPSASGLEKLKSLFQPLSKPTDPAILKERVPTVGEHGNRMRHSPSGTEDADSLAGQNGEQHQSQHHNQQESNHEESNHEDETNGNDETNALIDGYFSKITQLAFPTQKHEKISIINTSNPTIVSPKIGASTVSLDRNPFSLMASMLGGFITIMGTFLQTLFDQFNKFVNASLLLQKALSFLSGTVAGMGSGDKVNISELYLTPAAILDLPQYCSKGTCTSPYVIQVFSPPHQPGGTLVGTLYDYTQPATILGIDPNSKDQVKAKIFMTNSNWGNLSTTEKEDIYNQYGGAQAAQMKTQTDKGLSIYQLFIYFEVIQDLGSGSNPDYTTPQDQATLQGLTKSSDAVVQARNTQASTISAQINESVRQKSSAVQSIAKILQRYQQSLETLVRMRIR